MPVITMSVSLVISTLLVLLVPLYVYFRCSSRPKNPVERPIDCQALCMFPSFMLNLHNLCDYFTVVLARSGHSVRAHGPPGTAGPGGLWFFITCDPANVKHIFTTNYTNFPKGAIYNAIFDIMDGSLFTTDGEMGHRLRAKVHSFLNNPQLVAITATRCRDKVEKGLLPLFTRMASTDNPFDLQEVMSRFMFDLSAKMIFGVEPTAQSSSPLAAMNTVMEVAFFRGTLPLSCWKVLRWLNIGPERRLAAAHRVLRGFVAETIKSCKIKGTHAGNDEEKECMDFLSCCINDPHYADKNLLHATLIGYMLAARDTIATTLPWTFYNLTQNPDIVSNIRNELSPIASRKLGGMVIFEPQETKSLVYLTAVLYETLRLYSPVPIERKTAVADCLMPSGHKVYAGDNIIISLHSMGRMKSLWGKDCLDYNPNRWLSKDGNTLRHISSHKFLAFNSGPRICPGKDIAVMQMKTVIAATVWNFDMELVEGQSIQPKHSTLLQMKNGLTVKLKKRKMQQ